MSKQVKYIIVFLVAFAIRLIPFRAPNIEPIMASIMPLGKVYGGPMAFMFGFLSIALFDSVTSGFGIWTLVTGIAYGVVGFGAHYFFKNRTGRANYAMYAVVATLFYDAVTGLTIGPLFFGRPFMVALIGQIPFTALHLLGNVSFAIVLSPMIEKWMAKSEVKVPAVSKVVLVN